MRDRCLDQPAATLHNLSYSMILCGVCAFVIIMGSDREIHPNMVSLFLSYTKIKHSFFCCFLFFVFHISCSLLQHACHYSLLSLLSRLSSSEKVCSNDSVLSSSITMHSRSTRLFGMRVPVKIGKDQKINFS